MGTKFAEIYGYALDNINSFRLANDPNLAHKFTKLWSYLRTGRSEFTKPPGIQKRLGWTEATNALHRLTDGQLEDKTVFFETGIFCMDIATVTLNSSGNVIPSEYDSETGVVSVDVKHVKDGSDLVVYFYRDGEFDNELSYEERTILGVCMALQWFVKEKRNDELGMIQILKDGSLNRGSEYQNTRAMTEREEQMRNELQDKMTAYGIDIQVEAGMSNWTGW
jgi:hypothetical protein